MDGERCRDPCVFVCARSVTSSSVDGGGRGPADETDAKAFGRPFRILNYPKQSEISSRSILTLGPTRPRGRARDTFACIQNAPNRFKTIPIHTGTSEIFTASLLLCSSGLLFTLVLKRIESKHTAGTSWCRTG